MSRNELMLTIAAALLVGFSLIVSLVVPRRYPDFPGRRLGLFAVVAALFVIVMLGAVEVFGAEDEPAGEHAAETTGGEPPGTGEQPPGTGEEPTTGGEAPAGDAAKGEAIFTDNCASCHTLEAAGATGTVGPNLDDLKPSTDAVVSQVTNGGGGMPAFAGQLSDQEIQDVAAYVVASTQR